MSDALEIPANPPLSPGFDKARRLSRILSAILAVGFILIIVAMVGFTLYMAAPGLQEFIAGLAKKPIPPVGWGKYGLVILHAVPSLLALHYARRLFARFADGEVFSLATIEVMRRAALWIVVSGLVPPQASTLVVGMATYVAAYVMAEARRLADDSAGIV